MVLRLRPHKIFYKHGHLEWFRSVVSRNGHENAKVCKQCAVLFPFEFAREAPKRKWLSGSRLPRCVEPNRSRKTGRQGQGARSSQEQDQAGHAGRVPSTNEEKALVAIVTRRSLWRQRSKRTVRDDYTGENKQETQSQCEGTEN